MNAIVLIKQVPDTAQLSANMDGLKLMAQGGPRIVNPWDEYAIETGLQLKEEHGGDCKLLCLGTPNAVEALKTGLAMGASEAILLSDEAFANGDSLATARALVAALGKIGDYDVIIAGKSAIDGGTGHTAIQIAALLGIPSINYVSAIKEIDFAAKTITVERLLEGGRETVTSTLPAVVSVVKEINEPRYPSFMGIRKAAKAQIPTWGPADIDANPAEVGAAGSQVQWPEVNLPPTREARVEIIEGEPNEAAKALADKLIAEKII
ncbi:MAG: electron transfer flavoprotein subunit beta/FixA family protein [Anaerolineae bacterium]